MLIKNSRFLNNVKITTLVRTLADQLERFQDMIFLERTPVVFAEDGEITGKYRGQVFAADIIIDDQEAVTYESGSFEFYTTAVPNIKSGRHLTQETLNRLHRLQRQSAQTFDAAQILDWENEVAESLVMGLRQRINWLICCMQLDGLSYNRLGVNPTGVTWGMPSNLKVTPANGWDDATNGTPVTDLQVVVTETAPDAYGEVFNRATMTTKAFRYMTQTAEFQNRIKGELRYNFGTNQLNVRDQGAMMSLATSILGISIELYDGSYWERNNNGAKVRSKVLPANKVILSNTADDNDRGVMDFANGVVTESIVGTLAGFPGFNGEAVGPVAFYDVENAMNPPQITAWAVQRGWPRKHRETATAVLTVGTFS